MRRGFVVCGDGTTRGKRAVGVGRSKPNGDTCVRRGRPSPNVLRHVHQAKEMKSVSWYSCRTGVNGLNPHVPRNSNCGAQDVAEKKVQTAQFMPLRHEGGGGEYECLSPTQLRLSALCTLCVCLLYVCLCRSC